MYPTFPVATSAKIAPIVVPEHVPLHVAITVTISPWFTAALCVKSLHDPGVIPAITQVIAVAVLFTQTVNVTVFPAMSVLVVTAKFFRVPVFSEE
jgi:hypothetical protein